jgi:hypothetical protein
LEFEASFTADADTGTALGPALCLSLALTLGIGNWETETGLEKLNDCPEIPIAIQAVVE